MSQANLVCMQGSDIPVLKEQIQQVEASNANLTALVDSLKAKIEHGQEKLNEMREAELQHSTTVARIEVLKKDLEASARKIQEADEAKVAQSMQLTLEQRQRQAIEEKLKALEGKYKRAVKAAEQATKDKLANQDVAAERRFSTNLDTLDTLANVRPSVSGRTAKELGDSLEERESEMKTLQAEINMSQRAKQALEQEIMKKEQEVKMLQENFETQKQWADNEITTLTKQKRHLEAQYEQSKELLAQANIVVEEPGLDSREQEEDRRAEEAQQLMLEKVTCAS